MRDSKIFKYRTSTCLLERGLSLSLSLRLWYSRFLRDIPGSEWPPHIPSLLPRVQVLVQSYLTTAVLRLCRSLPMSTLPEAVY